MLTPVLGSWEKYNKEDMCVHVCREREKERDIKELTQVIVGLQFSSVSQLYLTICDPMDCSTPGFLVVGLGQSKFCRIGWLTGNLAES